MDHTTPLELFEPQIIREKVETRGMTQDGTPWSVHNGVAIDILRKFEKDSINCCVTSPPYYWLRDYGVENQIGLENTVAEYVNAIADTMDEVYRTLQPSGLLFLNLGDTYYSGKGEAQGKDRKSNKRRFGLRAVDKSGGLGIGVQRKSMIGIPWRVAIEMAQRGWILRSSIIWHRKKALPEFVRDRPRRSYEFVFMFANSRFYYFDRGPLVKDNVDEDVWTIMPRAKAANGIDTAPFPDELVERCLEIGCPPNGSVLDPFAGSGTTLRVAATSGRPATGIELNSDFCLHIVKELAKL
ncbi:MAG: site-specific DNA-methyltransferase [Acidobacteriota bacterium]